MAGMRRREISPAERLKWGPTVCRPQAPDRNRRAFANCFSVRPMGRRQAVRQWILIPPCGGSIPPAPARLCSRVPCKIARRIEIQHFAIEHRQQLHVSGLGELYRPFHQRRRRIVRRDLRAHDANDHLCVSFRHDDAGLTEYDPRRHVHDGRLAISFRHRREQGVHVGHRDTFQILCLINQFRHLLVGVVLVFEMNVIALVQQIAEREILGISMGRGSSGSATITAAASFSIEAERPQGVHSARRRI
jgi:hypothetical protein